MGSILALRQEQPCPEGGCGQEEDVLSSGTEAARTNCFRGAGGRRHAAPRPASRAATSPRSSRAGPLPRLPQRRGEGRRKLPGRDSGRGARGATRGATARSGRRPGSGRGAAGPGRAPRAGRVSTGSGDAPRQPRSSPLVARGPEAGVSETGFVNVLAFEPSGTLSTRDGA